MPATFVFMQVADTTEPVILVKSIRRVMPDARIIQCSDGDTRPVDGVSTVFRVGGDTGNLMTLRLKAFSTLGLATPAAYVDSDMVVLRPIDLDFLLGAVDVVVCERSFNRDIPMNATFRDLDYACYAGKTQYEALPYIACFTVTRSSDFWDKAYRRLLGMPPIFHHWFGDQEAIKAVVDSNEFRTGRVPELMYGCLPDKKIPAAAKPRILHFKGHERKEWMLQYR